MWKLLSLINHEETYKKKRQKEVSNRDEIGKRLMTFCRRQDGIVDSVRQESQLYIVEDNKVADGSMDSIIRMETEV